MVQIKIFLLAEPRARDRGEDHHGVHAAVPGQRGRLRTVVARGRSSRWRSRCCSPSTSALNAIWRVRNRRALWLSLRGLLRAPRCWGRSSWARRSGPPRGSWRPRSTRWTCRLGVETVDAARRARLGERDRPSSSSTGSSRTAHVPGATRSLGGILAALAFEAMKTVFAEPTCALVPDLQPGLRRLRRDPDLPAVGVPLVARRALRGGVHGLARVLVGRELAAPGGRSEASLRRRRSRSGRALVLAGGGPLTPRRARECRRPAAAASRTSLARLEREGVVRPSRRRLGARRAPGRRARCVIRTARRGRARSARCSR